MPSNTAWNPIAITSTIAEVLLTVYEVASSFTGCVFASVFYAEAGASSSFTAGWIVSGSCGFVAFSVPAVPTANSTSPLSVYGTCSSIP